MPLVQGKKADKLHNWWETRLSSIKGKAAQEAQKGESSTLSSAELTMTDFGRARTKQD